MNVEKHQRYTKSRPCPICGGTQDASAKSGTRCYGFRAGEKPMALCTRIESDRQSKSGEGWWHPTGDAPSSGNGIHPASTATRGISTEWDIRDRDGNVVMVHVRRDDFATGEKKFVWRQPDGTPGTGGMAAADLPLYGTELIDATDPEIPIYLVEGEKSADALRRVGLFGVGTVTGAHVTPSAGTLSVLVGRTVYLWPDNDEIGRKHMDRIREILAPQRIRLYTIRWPEAPTKGDAADFVNGGGDADAVKAMAERARRESEFELIDAAEIEKLPPPEYLIEGVLHRRKLLCVYGSPGSGKSLVALDWAASVATGMDWAGRATVKGRVVYVAGDQDVDLHGLRLRAWRRRRLDDGTFRDVGADPRNLLFIPQAVQMRDAKDLARLRATLDGIGGPIEWVVIDTVARCAAGADENSNSDMGEWIENVESIRRDFGCGVLLVHHSDKSGTHERGASALKGAVWSLIRCEKEDALIRLNMDKVKSASDAPYINLRLHVVMFSVLENAPVLEELKPGEDPGTGEGTCDHCLAALRSIAIEDSGVSGKDWEAAAVDRRHSRTVHFRHRKQLVEMKLVGVEGVGNGRKYVPKVLTSRTT